jgi:hypothetical protein
MEDLPCAHDTTGLGWAGLGRGGIHHGLNSSSDFMMTVQGSDLTRRETVLHARVSC